MDIRSYWKAALMQDAEKMKKYFTPHAVINWHNTNECFTVDEFICANCEYPGKWDGVIERIESMGHFIITAVHVFSCDKSLSFHVTSFIKTDGEKILSIDEYWGEDGAAPQWRLDKKIGRPIR